MLLHDIGRHSKVCLPLSNAVSANVYTRRHIMISVVLYEWF